MSNVTTEPVFESVAAELGWSESTQISVLLDYIQRQQSNQAFHDFLAEQNHQEEPLYVTEGQTFQILKPNGEQVDLALIEEHGSGNVFAVESSYVEQDNEVFSPYGNGPGTFREVREGPDQPGSEIFFHDVFELHVLSKHTPFDPAAVSLDTLAYEITEGECVGALKHASRGALSPRSMAERVTDYGSDESFFNLTEAVIRASEGQCISCEHGSAVERGLTENGARPAVCACGAAWIEHMAAEHGPVVDEVEILRQPTVFASPEEAAATVPASR